MAGSYLPNRHPDERSVNIRSPSSAAKHAYGGQRRAPGAAAIILICFWLAALQTSPVTAQVATYYTKKEAIALAFPNGEAIIPIDLEFSDEMKAIIEKSANVKMQRGVTDCYQGVVGTEITAYACIDNMIGRERYITYLVRINHPQGEIAFLEVMEYREAVGAVVHYPHFTGHFIGKTARDPVWASKDIPKISGATLSVDGLARGARKLLHLYHHYLRHLPVRR
ncbi:MAG: FMN-binding protein [SAR324 cluster bacterium]|nr:FMN-binding protein [SAR324 cluster bacterium]